MQKGFTIIELIVVIAIIAILAAIVLVGVTKYIKKSQDTASLADIKQLQSLATIYANNNGNFDNFCNSPEVLNINAALNKINSLHSLFCRSSESGANCVGGWVGWVKDNAKSKCLMCVDSTGNIITPDVINSGGYCYNSSTCACATP